jgi:hypothetical protein
MRARWQSDYERDLLNNLHLEPESDNSPMGTVRARMPVSGDPVFAARQDFRDRMTAGRLHDAVISVRTEQIIEELGEKVRDEGLDALLSPVSVVGPGVALSGTSPTAFLTGINGELGDVPPFRSTVFSARPDALPLHLDNIRLSLPRLSGTLPLLVPSVVTQGRDLIFANCRLVLSDALLPEILTGFEGLPRAEEPPDRDGEDPRASPVV